MIISIQRRYFLISLLIITAVYLPVLYTGVIGLDDIEIMEKLSKIFQDPNYQGLFIRNKPTVYYRPLLTIINLVDYKIWGRTIGGYHLTNYIFHIFNAILLYKISINIFKNYDKPYFYASISMLIFALNPLTCESVAWISGRSDIFGTFFSLLAVNSYFLKNKFRFILTPVFALSGFFCKENAFAVLPIIIILDIILNCDGFNTSPRVQFINKEKIRHILKSFTLWCLILLTPLLTYILLRTAGGGGFENDVARITSAAALGTKSYGLNISGYLKIFPAIAFYLKKLIIPFPLNFSIISINFTLYSVLFLLFLFTNSYWFLKKQFNFIIIGILLILSFLPALPIAIGGVSWAPFAERYLYLSLCVWGIAASYLLNHFTYRKKLKLKAQTYIILPLIIISIFGTLKRQSDWTSKEKLYLDTVNKVDPGNYKAIFNYAVSHKRKDRIKYLRQAEIASRDTHDVSWKANLYRAIAYYYAEYNLPEDYLKIPGLKQETVFSESAYIPPQLSENEVVSEVFKNLDIGLKLRSSYKAYLESANIVLKLNPENKKLKKQVFERAKKYYSGAYQRKPTPFLMYRIGGYEKLLNNNKKAAECFETVIKKFPNSEYASFSKTRLRKIKEEGLIK